MKTEKLDCYEIITERIVSLLEHGTIPWRKPWKSNGGMPRNLVSGKPYRGVNVWLLHSLNYETPAFLTYKQAQDLGGNVKRGEKACPVVFWKLYKTKDKVTGKEGSFPIMRFYYVFNLAQCENLPADLLPVPASQDAPSEAFDVTLAESIVTGYKNGPLMKHGAARACYSPGGDFVAMPSNDTFLSPGHYYATLFHELAHSTGHGSRLSRPGIVDSGSCPFGSSGYAKEELNAEMASAFLCGHAGISDMGGLIENQAAYIASWLEALRNDKKLVVQAAGLAQRAADYILGINLDVEPETTTATVEATETVNV